MNTFIVAFLIMLELSALNKAEAVAVAPDRSPCCNVKCCSLVLCGTASSCNTDFVPENRTCPISCAPYEYAAEQEKKTSIHHGTHSGNKNSQQVGSPSVPNYYKADGDEDSGRNLWILLFCLLLVGVLILGSIVAGMICAGLLVLPFQLF